MRSAFDAAVLLVSDGLVAVGRVLGGFRRRSGWERQAARSDVDKCSYCPVNDGLVCEGSCADALAAYESGGEALEPGAYEPPHGFGCVSCDGDIATCGCWDDDDAPERSAAVTVPAADNTPECECFWTDPSTWTTHYGATEPGSQMEWNPECPVHLPEPPVDDTTEVDHLEAAWHYHRPQANYNGNLVWGCEGCDWHGPTIQAHSRHRFHVLADMKAATTRVQEQLGGTA